jgi:hypothetical protein
MGTVSANYEKDFYAWANEQAQLLRAGKLAAADIEHIAEEIESMGKAEKRELVSRLTVLFLHLLKWKFQPNLRGRSWRLTIEEQRLETAEHFADNPSLKSKLDEIMTSAYQHAVIKAAKETSLDKKDFPTTCPWTFELAMTESFWPE